MKKSILLIAMLGLVAFFLTGCGNPAEVAVKKLFRPSPDKDVTASPEYNFSPFTNTIWKTKVPTAIVNLKRYTGAPEAKLLTPQRFDPKHPRYSPPDGMQIIAILSPGTHLRIARLMEDQGAWGAVQVEAIIEDGTNAQKTVYLEGYLLADNQWNRGQDAITNWGVNSDLLEK